MEKIDMILNGAEEQYTSLINKLSNILEPYALYAMGKAPVYVGRIVEELSVKQRKERGAFTFNIDGNDVAHVDLEKMEASVFGGVNFHLTTDDAESVKDVLEALKLHEGSDNDENPIKDIIEGMPKELKSLLGAVAVSVLRKRRNDNN